MCVSTLFICNVSPSPLCKSHGVRRLAHLEFCSISLSTRCLIQSKCPVSICPVDEFTTEPLTVAGGMLYVGCLWCWLYTLLTGLGVLRGTSSNVDFHPPQFGNKHEVCSFWWLRTQSPGGWVYVWVRWSLTCLRSQPLGRALTLSGTRTPIASFFSRVFRALCLNSNSCATPQGTSVM